MLDDDTVLEEDKPFSAVQALASRLTAHGLGGIATEIDLAVKRSLELWPEEKGEVPGQIIWMLVKYSQLLDSCRDVMRLFQQYNVDKAAGRSGF